jgi:hypothetical protein
VKKWQQVGVGPKTSTQDPSKQPWEQLQARDQGIKVKGRKRMHPFYSRDPMIWSANGLVGARTSPRRDLP